MASNSGFRTDERCRPQSRFMNCLLLMCITFKAEKATVAHFEHILEREETGLLYSTLCRIDVAYIVQDLAICILTSSSGIYTMENIHVYNMYIQYMMYNDNYLYTHVQ